jgi:hypothetical protein
VKRSVVKRIAGLLVVAGMLGPAAAERAASDPDAQASPVLAEPAPQRCPGTAEVFVRDANADDVRTVCDGASRALAFLARAGLAAPPATDIRAVNRLPGELAGRAIGCYLRDTRTILLLDYGAFESFGEWFRTPVDRELYASAASHEMAHAVVGCHAWSRRLPTAAHEYVAYVVMFGTMAPGLRERVLAKFPGPGFTSTLQISDVGHLADPNRFGVDAWRHYLGRRDRDAWLRSVISGEVVQELPGEAP